MLEISTLYFKTEKNFETESHFVAQANLILDRSLASASQVRLLVSTATAVWSCKQFLPSYLIFYLFTLRKVKKKLQSLFYNFPAVPLDYISIRKSFKTQGLGEFSHFSLFYIQILNLLEIPKCCLNDFRQICPWYNIDKMQ